MIKKKGTEMKEVKDCVVVLPCNLTNEELLDYSQDMAGLHQTKMETEDAKKESSKDFGARIQKLEADIHVLSRKISTRKEQRDVNCVWEFDYNIGEKILIRKDTGEEAKRETISAAERQRYLNFSKEPEPEAPSCAGCGVVEGESHDKACPVLEDGEAAECSTEETEEELGQEESGEGDCPDCGAAPGEECLEKEVEAGEEEKEPKPDNYQCAQCKKTFNEPGEGEGEDETFCPKCGSKNWY